MIVSGGVKVRSKSNREGAARADQLLLTKLKTAVANGTLRDMLWRPVVVNKVKSSASMTLSPPSKQQHPSTKQRRSAERGQFQYEYGDVEPFDEIRIWNELLTARVLKKRRNRFVFSNDTFTGSWRALSNIFESSAMEDAVDDSLFNNCELSHSDDVYGQQAPPLIPIKPPDTGASSASDVPRPVSSDEFMGRGQTFVTSDVAVETETVPQTQTAQPQPAVQTRSWTRRNGVVLSEADHARIMLEFQQRKALPSVGSSGRGTLVVVADSLRGMDLVFNTNDPMSVESDTESFEMTDELDDDIDEPTLEVVTAAEDCHPLEDRLRQSLPALVSEAATNKDSRRRATALEATGPVPPYPDEVELLLAEGVQVSLEDALLMEDNPVKGNSEVR